MQNQIIIWEQEIIKARYKLQQFQNNVDKILKYGYGIEHLNNLYIEIEQIQYPIYQMNKMPDLNPEITKEVLEINDKINNYKIMLDKKTKELKEKNNTFAKPNQFNLDPLDQCDDKEFLKNQNLKMQRQIRTLEENQEIQNIKMQNLQDQINIIIKQNIDLQNQVKQLNNQIIQNKNQIEEKSVRINQAENQIQQIQQNINSSNCFTFSDQQLQNSQVIQFLQNQFGQVNNQSSIVNYELARITQYQSIQPSDSSNY